MEKGDIMFGGIHADRFLQMIVGRRSFPHIHESNPKISGGDEAYERKNDVMVTLKGLFEG